MRKRKSRYRASNDDNLELYFRIRHLLVYCDVLSSCVSQKVNCHLQEEQLFHLIPQITSFHVSSPRPTISVCQLGHTNLRHQLSSTLAGGSTKLSSQIQPSLGRILSPSKVCMRTMAIRVGLAIRSHEIDLFESVEPFRRACVSRNQMELHTAKSRIEYGQAGHVAPAYRGDFQSPFQRCIVGQARIPILGPTSAIS